MRRGQVDAMAARIAELESALALERTPSRGTTLVLRVGTLTDELAFVRVFDSKGSSGEALLERRHLDEIAGCVEVRGGDYLSVDVTLRSRSRKWPA